MVLCGVTRGLNASDRCLRSGTVRPANVFHGSVAARLMEADTQGCPPWFPGPGFSCRRSRFRQSGVAREVALEVALAHTLSVMHRKPEADTACRQPRTIARTMGPVICAERVCNTSAETLKSQ